MKLKLNHLGIPYLAVLAFMFAGILNAGGIGWYRTLSLPAWNPPDAAIAVIWGVIYALAAWSLLIIWNEAPRDRRFAWIMSGFAASTLLNLVWSVLFFRLHLLAASVWCAVILGASVAVLAVLAYPRSRAAALLLVPYIAWVCFAAYLNHAVALLNL